MRGARDGDARAVAGLRDIGRYLGIGIANMIAVLSPDRVVLGGGSPAAGDLLFEPIREELRRRVRTTALDEVELVPAELGTWAGSIGAAVHGAERAGLVGDGRGAGPALPHYRQIELALRERLARCRRAPAAVRRGAVPRVRRLPDDGPQRDAAAGRGRAGASGSRAAARSRSRRRRTATPTG